MNKFREKRIVPNIIPSTPQGPITVQYTTEHGIDCGVTLNASETKDQPGIAFRAMNSRKLHTLVMFDPDTPKPASPYLANYRNWVVEDIPGDKFYKGYVVSSFAPPNPPFGSEPHRIIFLIYQQPRDDKLQESFDDTKRTNFQVDAFVRKRNLIGPIAGTFMYVRY
ncbi:phosphatidylethanolamine-binding protein 1 [Trichonephila inaurata madagascariensis]|uniref:Phosphatidylethanolamine-binding protein 1 n=1 Tax=Trichonephila inaurata madagascariensis TaxID=2747483 RepID=A0A8X6K094_9ARAC|nr:phosphatidylethanolamine-binding protein 1 [Trichonephila inaurata madagascariensis]